VARVIDGDTIELASGEKVRYLMVDTPETSGGLECFGEEAKQFNIDLVNGQEITLEYDQECKDRYDRLLAYVYLDGREVNTLLVERGYACVLHIPPNGNDREAEFEQLESAADSGNRGLWAQCRDDLPC
jgi:micrococcal nuclease